MVMIAHLFQDGLPVAEITYRAGMHVQVRIANEFRFQYIEYTLRHSENKELKGTWEEALDGYFNDGRFDSKDNVFPGEIPRFGCARDHKSLFRKASQCLYKDLEPHGFVVEIEFP